MNCQANAPCQSPNLSALGSTELHIHLTIPGSLSCLSLRSNLENKGLWNKNLNKNVKFAFPNRQIQSGSRESF